MQLTFGQSKIGYNVVIFNMELTRLGSKASRFTEKREIEFNGN